jgi:hypothetical protein
MGCLIILVSVLKKKTLLESKKRKTFPGPRFNPTWAGRAQATKGYKNKGINPDMVRDMPKV